MIDLHARIMKLRAREDGPFGSPSTRIAYKTGHRDARHAAAELASEQDVVVEELYEALEACVSSLVDSGRDHAPSVEQARVALAKARGDQP